MYARPRPRFGVRGARAPAQARSRRAVGRAVDDEDLSADAGLASPSWHHSTNSPTVICSLSAGTTMLISGSAPSSSPRGTNAPCRLGPTRCPRRSRRQSLPAGNARASISAIIAPSESRIACAQVRRQRQPSDLIFDIQHDYRDIALPAAIAAGMLVAHGSEPARTRARRYPQSRAPSGSRRWRH